MEDALRALLAAAAEEGARRALAALGITGAPDVRVTRGTAVEHGAPSWRWITTHAPDGAIRGPRGARYITRSDLDALLASSAPRRRARSASVVSDDDGPSVTELAARRARTRAA